MTEIIQVFLGNAGMPARRPVNLEQAFANGADDGVSVHIADFGNFARGVILAHNPLSAAIKNPG
jgi:hypothetical protein